MTGVEIALFTAGYNWWKGNREKDEATKLLSTKLGMILPVLDPLQGCDDPRLAPARASVARVMERLQKGHLSASEVSNLEKTLDTAVSVTLICSHSPLSPRTNQRAATVPNLSSTVPPSVQNPAQPYSPRSSSTVVMPSLSSPRSPARQKSPSYVEMPVVQAAIRSTASVQPSKAAPARCQFCVSRQGTITREWNSSSYMCCLITSICYWVPACLGCFPLDEVFTCSAGHASRRDIQGSCVS